MLSGTTFDHPLRVLVVDDELLMRWSIAQTLAAAGHDVVEAETGAAALDILAALPATDAVMLDYRLPDSNDLSLLARIRQLAPRTPVIVMTAHGTAALANEARQLGAYAVLDKPFDIQDVEPIVKRACTQSPT
jgi:DNA-binding NtrC family response regulator